MNFETKEIKISEEEKMLIISLKSLLFLTTNRNSITYRSDRSRSTRAHITRDVGGAGARSDVGKSAANCSPGLGPIKKNIIGPTPFVHTVREMWYFTGE